ncbi:ATP binding, partial [Rhizoctonia solani]
MKVFAEGPWSRPSKIILGIDIGTTQSAVAFAYLYPGGPQSIHRVMEWPGQESQKGESKIPTLVYYDSNNKPVSFGAAALKPEIAEKAEDEHWKLARHFKLHLHPEAMKNKHNLHAQPLPAGVSLLTIYTDFMVYLMQHTKSYFESRIIDGQKVWEEHHKDMTIVLAHPNGWGVKEQNFLRQAAIAANYVPSSKAIS